MQKNEKGFAHLEIVLISAIVLIIGSVGWFVYQSQKNTDASFKSTVNSLTGAKPDVISKNKTNESNTPSTSQDKVETIQPEKKNEETHCKGGNQKTSESKKVCSIEFTAKDFPARYQVYAVQTTPTLTQLYDQVYFTGTCSPEGACQQMDGGATVTKETRKANLDWKIVKEAKIELQVDEDITHSGSKWHFGQYVYTHEKEPICTANRWYCYGVRTEFAKQ